MNIQPNQTSQLRQVPTDYLEPDFYLDSNRCTLADAVQQSAIDPQSDIPFVIRLVEFNRAIALPGKIDLYGHDCIHALLNRGHSLVDEAFVKGFTMGSDTRTHWLHLLLFKLISSTVYPKRYRFSWQDFRYFDAGLAYGRWLQVRDLNRLDFSAYQNDTLSQVRQLLGISKASERELLRSVNPVGVAESGYEFFVESRAPRGSQQKIHTSNQQSHPVR